MNKTCFMASAVIFATIATANAQVLDKRQQLQNEAWWYNRDFDWYQKNIPFFECSDQEITSTYYYRWDLLTKHLTYGSPNTGYISRNSSTVRSGRELTERSVARPAISSMKLVGCATRASPTITRVTGYERRGLNRGIIPTG